MQATSTGWWLSTKLTRFWGFRPVESRAAAAPALCHGDLALTSTRLAGGSATAEVARRQPDGSWLWIIDQPNVLGA